MSGITWTEDHCSRRYFFRCYFIAAGLLVPDSEILVKNVGINPTRAGLLKVCEDMGGNITLLNERTEAGEKMADILVRSSQLHGISIHVISFPH